MIHKLYSLVDTKVKTKEPLYIRGVNRRSGGTILLNKGEVLDFTTYFNSVSLKKWRRYTTIERLQLVLHLKGSFQITFHLYDENRTVHKISIETCDSVFVHSFSMAELEGVLLGFTLQCFSDTGVYSGGEWEGQFCQWNDQKIGISITTFKREKYVKRTMKVLQDFQRDHPWLSVLVVDNGRTLQEVDCKRFRVIHNRNYGGSGGFARGMIEYVEHGKVNYVLLMDDDIVLETSALERTFSLLSGVKKEYVESFLAGAMLSMEKPTNQYENTACWKKIRILGEGKNLNLINVNNLLKNEIVPSQKNRYGAWWFCCIPVQRIKDIGYPLPIFIKGDDLEYGIRNHREVISMNGIGVWHQSLQFKINPVVNYYSDRNMLMINNYADDCNFLTFILAVIGRIIRRILEGNKIGIRCLTQALIDYNKGLTGITAVSSEEKMNQILFMVKESVSWSVYKDLLVNFIRVLSDYKKVHKDYITFRNQLLKSNTFWSVFLGIRGENE